MVPAAVDPAAETQEDPSQTPPAASDPPAAPQNQAASPLPAAGTPEAAQIPGDENPAVLHILLDSAEVVAVILKAGVVRGR